jgi:hypothetical protein
VHPNIVNSGVTSIGDKAFFGCSAMTTLHIPISVTAIGDYAFEGCTGLIELHIPDSVVEIGGAAFRECTSLRAAVLPNSPTARVHKTTPCHPFASARLQISRLVRWRSGDEQIV